MRAIEIRYFCGLSPSEIARAFFVGEATMAPHLMRMLSLKGAEVELRFLDGFRGSEFDGGEIQCG